ncbi:hypothetical protein [Kitasatospora sp. CB02891]|uniref:hypothetical protein n=1 Tax=Kitasatospora sp. CB02891 TaxID=2020329 RepID=UPI000C274579|nr:hypothetical protein [Kitasatospora sp. CB02891]PJN22386.1 hypothetical protein CG736_28125 [Kitasatospora sp. CB02891]
MSATPQHQSQQAEREELARLLPAAGDAELPRRRQLLLKKYLMGAITENSRPATKRRTLMLRVVLPLGVAAAVSGAALAVVPGHRAAPSPGVAAPGSEGLGSVAAVAYTLQGSSDGLVKLTILDGCKPADATQLQYDLDRVGVRSRVYAGEPGCHALDPTMPSYSPETVAKANQDQLSAFGWDMRGERGAGSEGARQVLTIRPSAIPADLRLFIYLPLAKTDPDHSSRELRAGLMQSPAPDCMPTGTYENPLASLYPTPEH